MGQRIYCDRNGLVWRSTTELDVADHHTGMDDGNSDKRVRRCIAWDDTVFVSIKAIPTSMLYASEVDGANRWQQVRHIILPQMRWPILFMTSYQTLSLLTSFEYILLATDGGPGRATEVWALAAYHTALNNYGGNLQYGLGAAYALALVFIGIGLSVVYLRLFNFKELLAKPRIEQ